MIFRPVFCVVLAVLAFGPAGRIRGETKTIVRNEAAVCRATGQEIYLKSNLPALYEEHFTVIDPWAGVEPTFDFFSRLWKAELKPKKPWANPVSIHLKFWLGRKDEIPSVPSVEELKKLVDEAFRHPWILRHLQSGGAKASLALVIRQELNGERDRLGLGFYLHNLGIEKTGLDKESNWERFGLNTDSQYFNIWLNKQTGSLVYRDPSPQSEDQDQSQITVHWLDVQGKVRKTQVIDRQDRDRP